MPLAMSNIRTLNLGGGVRQIDGEWTASRGDASGTYAVAGTVLSHSFKSYDADVPRQEEVHAERSVSDNITTLTLRHLMGVTNGEFTILVRGG